MRRSRRIRIRGVAADFRVPRGWPTPTERWIRENVFWTPPEAWMPRPDLSPAPIGWNFWLPNKHWYAITARMYRGLNRWLHVAAWLFVLRVVVGTVVAFIGSSPLTQAIGVSFGLAAIVCVVTHSILRARMTRRLLRGAEELAARQRSERLVREYQHYLVAV